MNKVCVLLAQGFEEIEATTVIDVLRRAEIDVTTLGVGGTGAGGLDVKGSHGIILRADKSLESGAGESWDMVVLPGGMPGSANLRDSPAVQSFIRKQYQEGKKIGAICAAPIALAAAGLLEGKKATSYPGFEKELKGAKVSADRVVCDGNIVTSRGPGTAFAFALEIVAQLKGKGVADGLRSGMLIST